MYNNHTYLQFNSANSQEQNCIYRIFVAFHIWLIVPSQRRFGEGNNHQTNYTVLIQSSNI